MRVGAKEPARVAALQAELADLRADWARTRRAALTDALRAHDALAERTAALRAAEARADALQAALDATETAARRAQTARDDAQAALERLAGALSDTAAARDDAAGEALAARAAAAVAAARQAAALSALEQAAARSVGPLEAVLDAAGLDADAILEEAGHDGAGGPYLPDGADDKGWAASVRAELQRVALLREAVGRLPFANPAPGMRFTSGFGWRRDPKNGRRSMHNGLDLAGPIGAPILSSGQGVVTFVGWRRGYGRTIEIDHGFGLTSMYAHLRRFRVELGERVRTGQRIGDMGASGRVTGSHLHYELHVDGRPVDPMRFIKAARDAL